MLHWILALVFTHAWAADKTACKPRELKNRDCRVVGAGHQIRLLVDTIARDLSTTHVVDPMPLKGDWEKVNFEITNGRPLLQLWIWDNGKGEAPVQSLHWFTADVRPGPLKIIADGVVRRRRLKPAEDDKKEKTYLYDEMEKHGLRVLKNGTIEWSLGGQTKTLEKGH